MYHLRLPAAIEEPRKGLINLNRPGSAGAFENEIGVFSVALLMFCPNPSLAAAITEDRWLSVSISKIQWYSTVFVFSTNELLRVPHPARAMVVVIATAVKPLLFIISL